jgi:hypothetical protein
MLQPDKSTYSNFSLDGCKKTSRLLQAKYLESEEHTVYKYLV